MPTIILTGGGTAGHCTPHVALLPYLKNYFDKIYYIGSENGIEKEIISKENIPYFSVPCEKLRRDFSIKNLIMPFKVINGTFKAGKIIDKLKPNIIFSKGGYVAVPTVIAGSRRNIPIISHESDYTLGLANKITAKMCKEVLTSFPQTALTLQNGKHVGSPIRKVVFNKNESLSLKHFGFLGKKPILLVLGGSLGSLTINKSLRLALDSILQKFDVIHVCGKNNLDNTIKKNGYYQTEYMFDIEKAFSIASVCVARAGSNSVFELMALKIPTVLIPLPKGASRGDQIFNAEHFQKLGLAYVLPQSALTPESLNFAVNSAYANRFTLAQNFSNTPIKDASEKIVEIIVQNIRV